MVYANDFEYCGEKLSSKGMLMGVIDGSSSTEEVSFGNITLNTIKTPSSRLYRIYNKTDGEPITLQFNIAKENGDTITVSEIGELKRWLQRGSYEWLSLYEGNEKIGINLHGYFEVGATRVGNEIKALNLKFTNDSTYTYSDEITKTVTSTLAVTDNSDTVGYLYPTVIINCTSENVELKNTVDGNVVCNTKLTGITRGAVVTLDCENKVITSTGVANLPSAFNFDFFKLCNTYSTRVNNVNITGGTATIKYREIKEGMI